MNEKIATIKTYKSKRNIVQNKCIAAWTVLIGIV